MTTTMGTSIYIKFIEEITETKDWIRELSPITDGEKIGKLQTILDRLMVNFRQFLIDEDTSITYVFTDDCVPGRNIDR